MTDKPPHRGRIWVTALLALAVAGALAVTFVGFGGRWHWALDLFNHFRVPYLIATGIVLLPCLLLRRWKLAAVATVAVVLNAATVLPLYLSPRDQPTTAHTPITIASVNLQFINEDEDAIEDFLNQTAADVVVLIELTYDHEDAIEDMDTPFRLVVSEPADHAFGIGVMVRRKLPDAIRITDARARMIGPDHIVRLAVEVDATIDGKPVRLLGIHPPPPMRDWAWRNRNDILAAVGRIAASTDRPLIVIGDMNTTPWSPAFSDMLDAGGLHNTQRGYGIAGSWPVDRELPFALPIDHCLVSDDWAVLDRHLGPRTGSDHLPLTVTLALRDSGVFILGGAGVPPVVKAKP